MDEHSLPKGFATLKTINREGREPFEDSIRVGVVTPISTVLVSVQVRPGVPTSSAEDHAINCTGVSHGGKALVLGQV